MQWFTHGTIKPPKPAPKQPHLPTTKLRTKWQPQQTLQPTLSKLLTNDHWGNVPTTNPVHFWVISKNVNSLSTTDNNLHWSRAVQAMLEMDAHVLCVQEPNRHWTDGIQQPIYHLFQRAFMHAKISTSNSINKGQNLHQLGGTFLTTLGCYAARVTAMGSNDTHMGRWTYHELIGKCNRWCLIVTAYWVGTQWPTIRTTTTYTQQYHILLSQNNLNPDPRKSFVLHCWQDTHDILLCLDANDSTSGSHDKGIERIIDETALINLHRYRHPQLHPPATHNRGWLTIDYCLGTPGFVRALMVVWMLPFGLPVMLSGDHQTLGLEFDHDILFGIKNPPLMTSFQWGIYSMAYMTLCKLCKTQSQTTKHRHLSPNTNSVLRIMNS